VLITLKEDVVHRRLFGTTRLLKYLRIEEHPYKRGDEVTMMIWEKIDIGRRVILDGKYSAILFEQEITRPVRQGDVVVGYIRKIEGKDIQVSMQKEGMELIEDAIVKLLDFLTINGGYARINDDTPPEEIKMRLRMSKKTFKRAAGVLLKQEKIAFTKFGMKLTQPPPKEKAPKFTPKPFKPRQG
jgi:predicted RNA-binding protein (virulence factor B family)